MPRTGLSQWSDIKSQFEHGLLLGNGASIALHPNFDYRNLVTKARANGLITERVKTVFDHFSTSDFEHVLNMVWHAHHLNMALEVKERKTARAYKKVREVLIETVRLIHPSYSDISIHLAPFASFLKNFQTMISLNYDLLVYWTRMYANEHDPSITFKDCFINTKFETDWRKLREPIRSSRKSILVFYPHGNLALTTDLHGNERKVVVSSAPNLLDQIQRAWETEECIPLFVSEGHTDQKLSAIYRSRYLTKVLEDVLQDIGVSLAVYGWSFGDSDEHILNAISRSGVRRIAVSIYTGSSSWRDFRDKVRKEVKEHFPTRQRPDLIFFDSASVPFVASTSK